MKCTQFCIWKYFKHETCTTYFKGSGRAFCAGGDIVALYHLLNKGKQLEIFSLSFE